MGLSEPPGRPVYGRRVWLARRLFTCRAGVLGGHASVARSVAPELPAVPPTLTLIPSILRAGLRGRGIDPCMEGPRSPRTPVGPRPWRGVAVTHPHDVAGCGGHPATRLDVAHVSPQSSSQQGTALLGSGPAGLRRGGARPPGALPYPTREGRGRCLTLKVLAPGHT